MLTQSNNNGESEKVKKTYAFFMKIWVNVSKMRVFISRSFFYVQSRISFQLIHTCLFFPFTLLVKHHNIFSKERKYRNLLDNIPFWNLNWVQCDKKLNWHQMWLKVKLDCEILFVSPKLQCYQVEGIFSNNSIEK